MGHQCGGAFCNRGRTCGIGLHDTKNVVEYGAYRCVRRTKEEILMAKRRGQSKRFGARPPEEGETNLARIRKARGYTQWLLEFRAGLPKKGLAKYEAEHRDINKMQAVTLYRIARVLRCTMEELLQKEKIKKGAYIRKKKE